MAAEKGLYRSIYSAIWEDPEFQAFDPDMMVIFFSLRTCRECNFPCIFSFYRPLLHERIPKMPPERIDAAFDRLIEAGWVQYERPVLWIVKGFKNEPSRVPKNQKQIDGVQNILNSLAKVRIVTRFREYYGFPAPPSDAGMDEGMDARILGRNEVTAGASKQRTGTGTGTGERKGSGSGAGTAHAEGLSPLDGGEAPAPSIKDKGNGTSTAWGKKGKRPDFAIIANLVAHIHDEDVQCRVVKAYDAVSSGTMEVDDALELLDQAEIGVRIRAELSQMFRSARHAAN